ncbi:MAG TPA: sulfurtransferase TusA family protein [Dehalococcoidia bacterium]|nr:sulfurtransferase TusA family protein [Dehalococcoidia bacterium]
MTDETISADDVLVAHGDACATLTPRIRQRLDALQSGGVLEVRTDDPAARAGLEAWSRLTGNAIVGFEEGEQGRATFLVRKK